MQTKSNSNVIILYLFCNIKVLGQMPEICFRAFLGSTVLVVEQQKEPQ